MSRSLLLATLVLVAACSGSAGSSQAAGCRAPVEERIDPRSTIHLFPGTPDPAYQTDPPTSGPHRLGPPPTGVVTTPIQRSRQVAMLELGYVILQYRDLSAAEVGALGQLAGSLVTVAPAAGPLPGRVVATAWTWKLVCSSVEPGAMGAFIAAHRGQGFAHGGFGPTPATSTSSGPKP